MYPGVGWIISVEHFQSLTHPDKMLPLSLFRNEAAIET